MRRSSRSTLTVNQNQCGLADRFAMCGLFSVNNAMQERDFLTQADMNDELTAMEATHPGQDHGCKRWRHYSMESLNQALNKKGYWAVHLSSRYPYDDMTDTRLRKRLATAKRPTRILLIGTPPGQQAGISHCVALTKGKLIDPDEGLVRPATAKQIQQWLPVIHHVYGIFSTAELDEFTAHEKATKAQREANRASTSSADTIDEDADPGQLENN